MFERFLDTFGVSESPCPLGPMATMETWLDFAGGSTFAHGLYRRPLFLGGEDVVANLELSDLDVCWTIAGQLRRQAKGLGEGRQITGVAGYE